MDRAGSAGDYHIRGVATTLALLDEQLCAFQRWARGHEAKGVLFREHNDLSPQARRLVLREVASMRATLREVRRTLGLQPSVQEAADAIWSWCWTLMEPLEELTGSHLRRYGEPPPELAEYLEPRVRSLCGHLERILNITREARQVGRGASRRVKPDGESDGPPRAVEKSPR